MAGNTQDDDKKDKQDGVKPGSSTTTTKGSGAGGKSDDSGEMKFAKVLRTGALIRLHDGNIGILQQPGVVLTKAKKGEDGAYQEVGGSDHTAAAAASQNLQRIGDALVENKSQRAQLLVSALKLKGGEDYLKELGVYDGEDDEQYIDPNTLMPNTAGLPEQLVSQVTDVTEALRDGKAEEIVDKKVKDPAKAAQAKRTVGVRKDVRGTAPEMETIENGDDALSDL